MDIIFIHFIYLSVGIWCDMLGGVFSRENPLPRRPQLRRPEVHHRRRKVGKTHPLSN